MTSSHVTEKPSISIQKVNFRPNRRRRRQRLSFEPIPNATVTMTTKAFSMRK